MLVETMSVSNDTERPQTYSSPAILERRRRILEETRKLIAEQGVMALSMNEVGRRAGVAKRTLYNAFQTRERMIASAIEEYFDDYVDQIAFASAPATLMHTLERIVTIVHRNQRIRNYIRAIMAVYFSAEVDGDIWHALHSLAARHNLAWLRSLQTSRQLAPWVKPEQLADDLVRLEYSTINDWVQGRIPDDDIVRRLVVSYLTLMLGALRGATRREVEELLVRIDAEGLSALPAPRKVKLAKAS